MTPAEQDRLGIPSIEEIRARAGLRAPGANGNGHPPSSILSPPPPLTPPPSPLTEWPAPPGPEIYQGLAGDVVRSIEPHSEADPIALLVQLLVAVGNVLGRTCHFRVEGDVHYCNLFCVMVGKSSKGRKGTSWGRIRQLMKEVEPTWCQDRVKPGLASGEGLVHAIRDPHGEDEGEPDKRILCLESEYGGVLEMMQRVGNSLSARIRQAWEGSDLGSLTKGPSTRCLEPHVSIIGHVTEDEVRGYLTKTHMANGFGNRHLWFHVRRSKLLPRGGVWRPDGDLIARLGRTIAEARMTRELDMDADADALWATMYAHMAKDAPGLTGTMLARAEPLTLRLACLYAVLSGSAIIRCEHLRSAWALIEYNERCVRHIFPADATGNPMADAILFELRRSNGTGKTLTEIHTFLGRNSDAVAITNALRLLFDLKLVASRSEAAGTRGGRPAERWYAL